MIDAKVPPQGAINCTLKFTSQIITFSKHKHKLVTRLTLFKSFQNGHILLNFPMLMR